MIPCFWVLTSSPFICLTFSIAMLTQPHITTQNWSCSYPHSHSCSFILAPTTDFLTGTWILTQYIHCFLSLYILFPFTTTPLRCSSSPLTFTNCIISLLPLRLLSDTHHIFKLFQHYPLFCNPTYIILPSSPIIHSHYHISLFLFRSSWLDDRERKCTLVTLGFPSCLQSPSPCLLLLLSFLCTIFSWNSGSKLDRTVSTYPPALLRVHFCFTSCIPRLDSFCTNTWWKM